MPVSELLPPQAPQQEQPMPTVGRFIRVLSEKHSAEQRPSPSPELAADQGELLQLVMDQAQQLGIPQQQQEVMIEQAEIMNQKHSPLCSHCLRVAALAVEAGELLGVEDPKKSLLAGMLHDVGKVEVSSAVLEKNTKYTDDDIAEMNTHSEASYRILSRYDSNLPAAVKKAAGTHHKRQERNPNGMDDSGLSPEELKIRDSVTIADHVDAVFRDDGYSEELSETDRRERILDHIALVLEQDIYNGQNRDMLAGTIYETLVHARTRLHELTALAVPAAA